MFIDLFERNFQYRVRDIYIAMLKWDAGPDIKYATVGFTQSKTLLESWQSTDKAQKKKKKEKK